MGKRIYVQQLDESDCGAAALAMILKAFNSKIPVSIVREKAQTDKTGTTALGILKAAESFHLRTTAIKADMSMFGMDNLQLPFIAHLDKDGLLHYVVVVSVSASHVDILDPDPSVKKESVGWDQFNAMWTGVALFFSPDENYVETMNNDDSLWKTAQILLKYKGKILTIAGLMLLMTLITIGGTTFLQQIVDYYVPYKKVSQLEIISGGVLIAYAFHALFTYAGGILSTALSADISKSFLLRYIEHLFELPVSFFESRKTGEITSRFNDANSIIESLSRTAITAILNTGTILVVGIVLAKINLMLFGIVLLVIPAYIFLVTPFVKVFDKQNNERMEQNSLLTSRLIEDLNGMASIKAMNAESMMFNGIKKRFGGAINSSYHYGITRVLQKSLKDFVNLFFNLGILFVGSILTIRGDISLGSLMAFSALVSYFFGPIEEIINLQDDLQTAKIANARLNQVLLTPGEKKHGSFQKLNPKFEQLTYKHVSFEYKYGQPVVHDVSFKITRNESVALVGFSGSGKSTIAKLMVDFYEPQEGSIEINGVATHQIQNRLLRSMICYLPQKPYIFSGTIAENIALSAPNATIEEIEAAAKIAEIDYDIMNMVDGYNTILLEDSGLSGGQLQRIAIARAVLSSSEVLILDESTSNLDLLTEKRVLDNLLKMSNRTIIFIAHRLEIAKKVDNVIVMTKGGIIEQGTHQQLMAEHGEYYKLAS